jgi:hypothetical protein
MQSPYTVPVSVVTVYSEARSSRTEDQRDGFMFKDRAKLFEVEFHISPRILFFTLFNSRLHFRVFF